MPQDLCRQRCRRHADHPYCGTGRGQAYDLSSGQLHVLTRAAGAATFANTLGQTVAISASSLELRGLVVDPDGAAVGTLGGAMTTVYDDTMLPKGQPTTYGRIPASASVMDSMALSACGGGVLVFSINPVNNFNEQPSTAINDGIYVASTKGCP